MIIAPNTAKANKTHEIQRNVIAQFMQEHAGVDPSDNTIYLGWVSDAGNGTQKLELGVAFSGFMGNCCQIHVAMAPNYKYSPREMLTAAFRHAFETMGIKRLLGIVNSKNEQAMAYDLHLGFEEIARIPGAHDEGGDIVILSMQKEQCKYLSKKEAANEQVRHQTPATTH